MVGVRPEHLTLSAGNDASAIPIALNLVEPLGSEALLHASFGEHQLIIKAETHGDIDHLSGVTEIHAPKNLVSVFDKESGEVLTGKYSK